MLHKTLQAAVVRGPAVEGRPADIHLLAAPCQYVPGNKLARSQTAGLVGLIDQWSGTQHSRHKD